MNVNNYPICSKCMVELIEDILIDKDECRVTHYHCKKCCYRISMFSITKTRFEEIQKIK